MTTSPDLLRRLTGGAEEEPEHALAGVYLGKVTRATATELHFVIEDFSSKLEFGPAPYPRPGGETEEAGGHDHGATAETAGDHDHAGVALATHDHLGGGIAVSAGTPDVSNAGGHTHTVDVETVAAHVHELTPGDPPEGTEVAVAFVEGDPDRPLVLVLYGWPP